MARASLKSISKYMKGIDYCHLTTADAKGKTTSRPMSNNGDVDYDGTSYFFTYAKSKKVKSIQKNPNISLQFANLNLLKKNVFISVEAKAKLVTDRDEMEAHWQPSLNIWFPDGLDTKGITMIAAKASHIHYWAGMDEGEYSPKA